MAQDKLNILLALDEREPSKTILESAAKTLRMLPGYDLHVITVLDSGAGDSVEREAQLEVSRGRVREAASRFISEYDLTPRHAVAHVRMGNAAQQIVQAAVDLDVDFLMIGTHGRSGLSRLVLGSVAEQVVRNSTCPVLVFRAQTADKVIEKSSPTIEPPCPRCAEVRAKTDGAELWCAQHAEAQERRHTYFQRDRNAESDRPLGSSGLHL